MHDYTGSVGFNLGACSLSAKMEYYWLAMDLQDKLRQVVAWTSIRPAKGVCLVSGSGF